MKKLNLILILFLNLLFMACESDILVDEIAETVKIEQETTPKTWQEQLDFAKKHSNTTTKSQINQISFVEYTNIYKIESKEQIETFWNNLFDDKSEIVIYPNQNTNYFEIISLGLAREKYQNLKIDQAIEFIKNQLDSIVDIGTELIDLEWKYNGRIIHSTAIIHRNKIVYDHIGSMIAIQETPQQKKPAVQTIKTRTEGSTGGAYTRSWKISDGKKNFVGEPLWEYDIQCYAFFGEDGKLTDFSAFANYKSGAGWSCDAKAQKSGGEIGKTDYCQFTWGYAYKFAFSASVSINGTSVTITPGATGASGTFALRK